MMFLKSQKLPRGLKYSLWSLLDAALYPVVYLATVPILMGCMGLVEFGLWILLNSLITILQLFNFNSGVGNVGLTTIRNVTHAIANNDLDHAKDVINGVLHLTVLVVVVVTG